MACVFFKLPLGYLLCCKGEVGELTYEQIKALQLADNVEWPKPQGGAKDPWVAVCACFCVSVWHLRGRAHIPSKKKDKRLRSTGTRSPPEWSQVSRVLFWQNKRSSAPSQNPVCQYEEFIRGMDLLHNKDHSNDQIYWLPQFRASRMYVQPNALIE